MLKGKPGHRPYTALVFTSAFHGNFLCIAASFNYSQSKHKDNPRGDFYVYDEQTRTMGYAMLVIGVTVLFGLVLNSMY